MGGNISRCSARDKEMRSGSRVMRRTGRSVAYARCVLRRAKRRISRHQPFVRVAVTEGERNGRRVLDFAA